LSRTNQQQQENLTGPKADGLPEHVKAIIVQAIALGIVLVGFATVALAPWYAKVSGLPTVLLGIVVFWYPNPRDHLRVYRRQRDGPDP
jgi:hypothetical protein